jgi:hypothetical protein
MSCRTALLLALCCAAAQAGSGELSPRDFAYVMPVSTPAPAAAYSLTLPLDVWRGSAHPDLRDIRVFNARGAVVPYELRPLQAAAASRSEGQALPLFPLPADARLTWDGVRISVESRGAALDVHTAAAQPGAARTASYLIDARALAQPLDGFRLHWENGAADFTGSLQVEASDDLAAWRLVERGTPIVNLTANDALLVQSRITLPSTRARFWRMTWTGKPAPFALSSVTADTANAPPVQRLGLAVLPQSWDERRHEFTFDLGTRLPVEQIDVELPEANSVVRLQILSRSSAAEPWHAVTGGEFFRIQDGSGERRNEPIAVPPDADRYWLVRLARPDAALGAAPPRLQVAWRKRELVFLARGSGPFLLAYGDAALEAAATPLDDLIGHLAVQPAELGPPRISGGPARLALPPRTLPWRMLVLWSVLAAGVLLLGWMALRLSRELARTSGTS